MIGYYLMTAESAEEFWKRSLEREAVTEKEKLDILAEMKEEGLLIHTGVTDMSQADFTEKLSQIANVHFLRRPKRKPGLDNDAAE